jgi:hypothetical protein
VVGFHCSKLSPTGHDFADWTVSIKRESAVISAANQSYPVRGIVEIEHTQKAKNDIISKFYYVILVG